MLNVSKIDVTMNELSFFDLQQSNAATELLLCTGFKT